MIEFLLNVKWLFDRLAWINWLTLLPFGWKMIKGEYDDEGLLKASVESLYWVEVPYSGFLLWENVSGVTTNILLSMKINENITLDLLFSIWADPYTFIEIKSIYHMTRHISTKNKLILNCWASSLPLHLLVWKSRISYKLLYWISLLHYYVMLFALNSHNPVLSQSCSWFVTILSNDFIFNSSFIRYTR